MYLKIYSKAVLEVRNALRLLNKMLSDAHQKFGEKFSVDFLTQVVQKGIKESEKVMASNVN